MSFGAANSPVESVSHGGWKYRAPSPFSSRLLRSLPLLPSSRLPRELLWGAPGTRVSVASPGVGGGPSGAPPDSLNQPGLPLGLCDPERLTLPVWSSHTTGFQRVGGTGQLARLRSPYAWDGAWQLKEKSLQGFSGK